MYRGWSARSSRLRGPCVWVIARGQAPRYLQPSSTGGNSLLSMHVDSPVVSTLCVGPLCDLNGRMRTRRAGSDSGKRRGARGIDSRAADSGPRRARVDPAGGAVAARPLMQRHSVHRIFDAAGRPSASSRHGS